MTLYELCVAIYNDSGASGVINYIATNHPELQLSRCEPCDCDTPSQDNTCLVCGSTNK